MLNPTEAIRKFLQFLDADKNTVYRFGNPCNSVIDNEKLQRKFEAFCKANDLPEP